MSQSRRPAKKPSSISSRTTAGRGRQAVIKHPSLPHDYAAVLSDLKQLIAAARRRALATVNRELVGLYWHIGRTIVQRQQQAAWGDAVVDQLSQDLRLAFPDFAGLTSDNMWRMRKFYCSCEDIDRWLSGKATVATLVAGDSPGRKLGTACPEEPSGNRRRPGPSDSSPPNWEMLDTLSPQIQSAELRQLAESLSWSHHRTVLGAGQRPDERYFYLTMAVRERWSVRELRRQVDSALFLRYVSVRSEPEKCLPAVAEQGDLLPFKDHDILEFLGLQDEHTERELRSAILANLRQFFLEFGRDLTLAGEEYPLTIEGDTFRIDLLLFHRRLQCLIAVDFHPVRYRNHARIPLCLRSSQPEGRAQLRWIHQRSSATSCRTSRGRSAINHKSPTAGTDLLRSLLVSGRRNSAREVPENRVGKTISEESPRPLSHGVKIGEFLSEHVGKSLFYVAALDEQVRLPHENPSIGLILCRSAKQVQVRLALTPAAKKIGVATYQTALPDEKLIRQRLRQLPAPVGQE